MSQASPQAKGVSSKLESLPKEELLKFIKKQAIGSKELKKKIEELNEQLKKEQDDIFRLENEKKDWLSRGVTAEFEKKDKECREELKDAMRNTPSNTQSLTNDNEELKLKIKDLEQQLSVATSNSKYQKLKEKYDETIKENKTFRESKQTLEEECKKKSQRMVNLDKEMNLIRKESAELQKQLKSSKNEIEDLTRNNESLSAAIQVADENTKFLEERNQKLKQEKDNQSKTIKTLKTKIERAGQMEEKKNKTGGGNSTNYEKQLSEKEECIKELQNQISLIEKENTDLQNGLSSISEKNDKLKESYQGILIEYEKQNLEIAEHKDQNKILKCEKDAYSDELKILKDKLKKHVESPTTTTKVTNEKKSGKGKKSKKQTQQASLKADKKSGDNVVVEDSYKSKYEELKFTYEELQKEVDMYRTRSPETKGTILRLENRVDELLNQLQTLNEEKLNQENELEELFKSFDDLRNKYDFECKERESLEKDLHSLEEKLKQNDEGKDETSIDLEEQIRSLEITIKELTSDKDYLKQEVQVKEDCIKKLSTDLEESSLKQIESNKQNNDEIDRIIKEFHQLNQQMDATKFELENEVKEKENAFLQIEVLKTEINSLNKNISQISEELDTSKNKLTEKEEDIVVVNENLVSQSEIVELQQNAPGIKYVDSESQTLCVEVSHVESQNNVPLNEVDTQTDSNKEEESDMLNEYKSMLTNLENEKNNEISVLRNEIENLDINLQNAENEYQRLISANSVLEEKLNESLSKENDIKETLEKLQNAENEIKDIKVDLNTMYDIFHQNGFDNVNEFQAAYVNVKTNYDSLKDEMTEFNTVKEQLKDKEVEINTLNESLIEVRSKLDASQLYLESNQKDLELLREENEGQKKKLEEAEYEIKSYEQQIEAKQADIQELQNSSVNVKENQDNEEHRNKILEEELETLRKEKDDIKNEFEMQLALNSECNKEIESLKNELSDNATRLQENSDVNVSVKSELNSLQKQLDDVNARDTSGTEGQDEPDGEKDDKQSINDLKTDHIKTLKDRENEISELRTSLENLKQLYNECRIDNNTNNENYCNEIHEKDNIISSLKDDKKSLTKTLEQCHMKIAEFADMCNSLQDTIEMKHQQLEDLSTQKNSYKESVQEKENEMTSLKDLLDSKHLEIEELKHEVEVMNDKLKDVETKINCYEEQIKSYANNSLTRESEFQNILKTKDEELNQLNTKIQNFSNSQTQIESNLNIQIEELQNVLTNENKEKKSLEGQLKTLEDSIKEYQVKSHDLEQSLTLKDKEIAELKDYSIISLNESKVDFENRILELEDKCLLLQDENNMLSDDLSSAEDHCKNLSTVIDDHEKDKSLYSNLEDELQSAINKVDDLDMALKKEQSKCEQLQYLLNEKNEKAVKFKSMAIKAKKELDSKRAEFMDAKTNLETHLKLSFDEIKLVKAELTRQKTECAKHEEEFVEMQNEIKTLEEQLHSQTTNSKQHEDLQKKLDEVMVAKCTSEEEILNLKNENKEKDDELEVKNIEIEELNKSINELSEEIEMKNSLIEQRENEMKQLNDDHEKLRESLQHAEKGSQQLNLMALEIDDYEKTTEGLNQKLKNKDEESILLKQQIEEYKSMVKNLEDKKGVLTSDKTDMDNMNRKLKQMIMKLKKEISDLKKNLEDSQSKDAEAQKTIEQLLKSNDECKIEISNLSGEKAGLKEQLKRTNEMHEKAYQSLEVKFARANNDVIAKETIYQQLQEEYENYKVRAHSVLKQQKNMKNENQREQDEKDRNRYEEVIDDLKLRLQETNQQLNIVNGEHGDLEIDHERLQTKYAEMMQQLTNKEIQWKERFLQVKSEFGNKTSDVQQKLSSCEKLLSEEKIKNEEMLKTSIEKEHVLQEEIKKIKQELRKVEKQHEDSKQLFKQHSNESKHNDLTLSLNKSVCERQEGEGMDSRELELIDSLSQKSSVPQTPNTPSEAFMLETLLSPIDKNAPKSPTELRDEVSQLKSTITILNKKNEHVTSLLRECEENSCMLTDQAKILKEEIRRLERNAEREQALSNLEYLKNVIIKFLQVGSVEKEQLIPVLCTMLKLSNDEKEFIKEFAKGDNSDAATDASWSSYVYSWTSMT